MKTITTLAALAAVAPLSGGATVPAVTPADLCASPMLRLSEARDLCEENDPFDDLEECTVAAVEMLSDMFCRTQH